VQPGDALSTIATRAAETGKTLRLLMAEEAVAGTIIIQNLRMMVATIADRELIPDRIF
jgi:hypothetical protein